MQFWQFFSFKTAYHLRLWEKEQFEAVISDKLESGSTRKHALAATNCSLFLNLVKNMPASENCMRKHMELR